jgi:hypothetical protein
MRLRYALFLAPLLVFAPAANAATGYSASLNGAQEVGPVPTPATGTATLILDNGGTNLSYTVTYSGLLGTLTASHIHKAPVGVNGGVLFGFSPPIGTTSGTFSGVVSGLTAANVSDLNAGLYYVNIHSTLYPGGEIRGQIGGAPTPTGKSTWGRIKSLYRN